MSAPLAFVDTETTGLDPEQHEVWEVGLILRDNEGVEVEYLWQLPVDLGRAEAMALKVGDFYGRRWPDGIGRENVRVAMTGRWERGLAKSRLSEHQVPEFAQLFAELTHGAHLVGAVPSFDDAFLKRLLRANGACPGWSYHLVDVEALAAGIVQQPPPWDSSDLSRWVGVDPDEFEKHTALGDARWAKAIFDAVMTGAAEDTVRSA